MEQLGFHWWVSIKLDIWEFLRKSVEKFEVPLKSDKNKGYFTRARRPMNIYDI
jgi:hypothetical protein